MKRFFVTLAISLLAASAGVAQNDKDGGKPEKIAVEDLVKKHLESIGTPEALAAVKSRVLIGQGAVSAVKDYVGSLTGPAQMASETDKVLLVMMFNSNDYPYEKAAFDGKSPSVGLPNGNRTSLSQFLKSKESILKEGLLGGALSSSWPLLDLKGRKAKVEFSGAVKLGDRYLYKLKFSPRSDDLRVSLFFDPKTFRHVATEYQYTVDTKLGVSSTDIQAQKDYYTMTEQFSDFKKAGDLTLPFTYSIAVDIQRNSSVSVQTIPGQGIPGGGRVLSTVPGRQFPVGTGSLFFMFKVAQVFYNEPLEANVFKVS